MVWLYGFRGVSEFWEQDLAFIVGRDDVGKRDGRDFVFWGVFDAVEDFVVEDFCALVHWVLGAACLDFLDGAISHRFEVLGPALDDCVSALCLSEGVVCL